MSELKILLVAPFKGPSGIKDMFIAPNIGLYRIKCYIEQRFSGACVDVIDPNVEELDFRAKKYDCIGFSLTHTTLEHDISLIYKAKSTSPRSLLVAGGVEATFVPHMLLESAPLDCVVLGEGEEVLEEILHRYDRTRDFKGISDIPGLASRNGSGKAKISSLGRFLDYKKFSYVSSLLDFSKVPYPVFWRANASQYRQPDENTINTGRIFTSNYCPHNCTFCSATNFLDYAYCGEYGRAKKIKLVALKPEEIVNMIMRIVSAYPETKTIMFDDDNFIMTAKRAIRASQAIVEAKKQGRIPDSLSFICQARIDNFKSEEARGALALMKQAGFRMIMYGVESFSEVMLKEFGKNDDTALIDDVLKATARADIQPLIYLILFSPKSTMDDIRKTVIKSLDYLSLGMEISVNFYIMDIPGCHYQKEEALMREYKEIPINLNGRQVSTITKSEWIYPSDERVRTFAKNIYDDYPRYEYFFKDKFGIQHIPGRVYTFIVFYAILNTLGYDKHKERLLGIFQCAKDLR